ncbi:MAG TPA: hypothetical protein VHB77_00680, partial [Planctomycetaceae bacterium]|nr:hypothetical protein [Planctomycetaceae bacterium]
KQKASPLQKILASGGSASMESLCGVGESEIPAEGTRSDARGSSTKCQSVGRLAHAHLAQRQQ